MSRLNSSEYEAYMVEELKGYTDHFSTQYSKDITDYAESIFLDYMFTSKVKGQQYGYCTHCGKKSKTDRLGHKERTTCPACNEAVYVQSVGMGRSSMVNEAYFIYYEKSVIDPNVITARGIYAVEDYRGAEYKQVKPQMTDRTLYIFKIGEATMLKRYSYYSYQDCRMSNPHTGCYANFEKTKSIHSELGSWSFSNSVRGIACYSRESVKKAVIGTPFQYSEWREYNHEPMVEFFGLYCKYPKVVEYLTKCGFDNLIDAKLMRFNTCGAVNWRGKTIFDMLRVNRAELRQLKASSLILSPFYIRLFQINKKDSNGFNMYELKQVEDVFGTNQVKDINAIIKHSTLKKAFNYIKLQYGICKTDKDKPHFYAIAEAAINYRDYIEDCEKLEMDMHSDSVLFPRNLYTAHQNTISQIKVKENKHLNEKIAKRLDGLNQKYCFKHKGLLIRPAKDSKELIEEGKALSHCVGNYAERYAKGQTIILFIRKTTEPDKPFYTLEVGSDNEVIQCRGNKNCAMTSEVRRFTEVFENKKLKKSKKQERIGA